MITYSGKYVICTDCKKNKTHWQCVLKQRLMELEVFLRHLILIWVFYYNFHTLKAMVSGWNNLSRCGQH